MANTEKRERIVNMDSHSTCRNLCNWDIYFTLSGNGGDKKIKANGTLDILNREIISLCNNNDIFFVGTDGQGSHARIYIENEDVRMHVGFDSEDGKRKQQILSDEKCKDIFELKSKKAFEDNIRKEVVTDAEKDKIIQYARKSKVNDFDRIVFLEEYTGKKFKV